MADALLLRWNTQNPDEKWAPEPLGRRIKIGDATRDMTPEEFRAASVQAGQRVRALLAGKLSAAQVARPTAADVKTIRQAFEKARDEARDALREKAGGTSSRYSPVAAFK